MNANIEDLLEEIDEEIDKAWSLPLTGGKCAIAADWLREKIDDVRANLPSEVRQAKAIVADRADIIATAKKEAEDIIRKAEERARRMVAEEEIYKQAQTAASELLSQSQQKAREMRKGATDFAITGFTCDSEYQGFTLTLEDGILLARLTEPELASNGSLKLYPILTHLPTGQQVTLDKALTLKVQIYSGRPSVTVSASGKLDTIVPGSRITYTIKKLSNISGTPEAVRLEGIGAEQFRVTLEGNTAVLTLDPEVPQLKGKTY
ncbi:MAG: hypothetical protein IJZ13_05165, partial [Clostridia bacterium]|nr:hypothetical protein [Clostridia bacterium]